MYLNFYIFKKILIIYFACSTNITNIVACNICSLNILNIIFRILVS